MEESARVIIKRENEESDLHTEINIGLDYDFKVEVKSEEYFIDDYNWCLQKENEISEIESDELTSYEQSKDCKPQCTRCNMLVKDSNSLLQHNLKHLKIILTPCDFFKELKSNDYDDIIFYPEDKIKDYLAGKIKPPVINVIKTTNMATKALYKCNICNKTYKYKHWQLHLRQVHGKENIVCNICNKVFKCKRYFQRHMMYIHDGIERNWCYKKLERVICDLCSAEFQSKQCLTKHLHNCHSSSAVCKICNTKLKCKAYLRSHMSRVHYNDGKEHRCNVCHKNFRSPRYLKVHKKSSGHFD